MKRLLAVLVLVFAGLFGLSGVASAQTADEPRAEDFIDPETGEIDIDAYLAAVAAANQTADDGAVESASGDLPATGSEISDLVLAGAGLIVVGGAAVAAQRRRVATATRR